MRLVIVLVAISLPQLVWAQDSPPSPESSPPEPAPDDGHPQAERGPEIASTDTPPGLPAQSLEIAHSGGAELAAGQTIELGRPLSIGEDACLSLVAGDHASLSLTGPAEIHGEGRDRVMELAISSGRGVLLVDATGATIHLGDHVVSIRNGALAFDVSASTQVWLLEGEGRLDGAALELAPNEAPLELARGDLCLPPRPRISIPLGDPGELLADLDRTRNEESQTSGGGATAESGATCVDSSESSAATDPNQGMDSGIDPDARRNEGQIRLIVTVPRRSE